MKGYSVLILLLSLFVMYSCSALMCPVPHPCDCIWDSTSIKEEARKNTASCVKTRLRNVPGIVLSNSTIYTANFSGNALKDIPDGKLNRLPGLSILDLSENSLTSLPSALQSLEHLTRLHLGGNQISLDDNAHFDNLQLLLYLDLRSNHITSIKDNSFNGLDNLEYLLLTNNQINTLNAGLFAMLSSLGYLHIEYNQIVAVKQNCFSGLSKLKSLYLNHNKITTLPDGLFRDLAEVTTLDIADNEVQTLGTDAFKGLINLRRLYLERNQIASLPPGVFAYFIHLEMINLGNNPLHVLHSQRFKPLGSSLHFLFLDGTQIDTFQPPNFFDGLPELQVLRLSGTPLYTLPNITGMPQLTSLAISETLISTIYPCDLEGLDKLNDIHWGKAPIACNCNTKWLKERFTAHQGSEYSELIWVCEYPARLKGKHFKDVSENNLTCPEGQPLRKCHEKVQQIKVPPSVWLEVTQVTTHNATVAWGLSSVDNNQVNQVLIFYHAVSNQGNIHTRPLSLSGKQSYKLSNLTSNQAYNVCVELLSFEEIRVAVACSYFSTRAPDFPWLTIGLGVLIGGIVIIAAVVIITMWRRIEPFIKRYSRWSDDDDEATMNGVFAENIPNSENDIVVTPDTLEINVEQETSFAGATSEA